MLDKFTQGSKTIIVTSIIPTPAITQLRDLLVEMRKSLPWEKVPVLMILSKQDEGIAPHDVEEIRGALGCQDKQFLWVENSGQVVTCDPYRLVVFKAADEFIRRVKSTNMPV